MDTNTDKTIIIEQHKKFSQSTLWKMQRDYFDREGINAWVSQVPFYVTSNPYIAKCYAHLTVSFIRDWIHLHPASRHSPFYILELGTGSGRLSYYVIKQVTQLLQRLHMDDIQVCYIMSDFTKNNIHYYEAHPALKPYIDKGLIDFAMYDMETEQPISLIRKKIQLNQETLANPLIIFANYIFDTISHDAFSVQNGKLYELLIKLTTTEDNLQNNFPINMEKLSVDFDKKEIKSTYYDDATLDSILESYKKSLHNTSFLFPIGSFRAINLLRKLSNNKLFIISTDKGYNTLKSLDQLDHPAISFHGSFSMMVNFHALSEYFKNIQGDAFLQTPRKGIKTAVFIDGLTLNKLPETSLAINEYVEGFSPADYFTLHRRMSDSFNECNLDIIASYMQLIGWDPHMYLKMSGRIISLIAEDEHNDSILLMTQNMSTLAENYYYMPKTDCILFEIAIFFHAIKHYKDALYYYHIATPYIGEQFGLYFNIALCLHYLDRQEDALKHFKKAMKLDPHSKATEEWITHLSQVCNR